MRTNRTFYQRHFSTERITIISLIVACIPAILIICLWQDVVSVVRILALGGPRVMRTTGQMGAAVGFAAALCKKYGVNPRDIYTDHLEEYMNLILNQQWKNP